jgi:hypothetical protein
MGVLRSPECLFVSPVKRDGDSVITIPRLVRLNVPGIDTYADASRESRASWRASLDEARALATRWASVAPNDRQPHEQLGRALLLLEDERAASTERERAATLGTTEAGDRCSGNGSRRWSSPTWATMRGECSMKHSAIPGGHHSALTTR